MHLATLLMILLCECVRRGKNLHRGSPWRVAMVTDDSSRASLKVIPRLQHHSKGGGCTLNGCIDKWMIALQSFRHSLNRAGYIFPSSQFSSKNGDANLICQNCGQSKIYAEEKVIDGAASYLPVDISKFEAEKLQHMSAGKRGERGRQQRIIASLWNLN